MYDALVQFALGPVVIMLKSKCVGQRTEPGVPYAEFSGEGLKYR